MNKPLFGMLLGVVLGIFDGLSAVVSAPETRTAIVGLIVAYATQRHRVAVAA